MIWWYPSEPTAEADNDVISLGQLVFLAYKVSAGAPLEEVAAGGFQTAFAAHDESGPCFRGMAFKGDERYVAGGDATPLAEDAFDIPFFGETIWFGKHDDNSKFKMQNSKLQFKIKKFPYNQSLISTSRD